MAKMLEFLTRAAKDRASDLFVVPGAPISIKWEGQLRAIGEEKIIPSEGAQYLQEIYELAERDMKDLLETGDDDFSFAVPGLARFRVNAYRQRGSLAAVIRVVAFDIPDPMEYGIPKSVLELAGLHSGMVLVTGTAGSGKSTTLACLVDKINRERACHIITLEDPIEYLHQNQKSIVSQREIAVDTVDYLSALRACLRQAPDVIQLGEMRDLETIRTAMTAAETGHLVLGTLHTRGAVNAIDRILDAFPADQQEQILLQLSSVLQTVISQQLVPGVDGTLIPVFEILHLTGAVRNMIRERKTHQMAAVIASGGSEGMISMDQSLLKLYQEGKITRETALAYAENVEHLSRRM